MHPHQYNLEVGGNLRLPMYADVRCIDDVTHRIPYLRYFDDSRTSFPSGPIMYTKTTGSAIYTLPTADMFIKILGPGGVGLFCICVTPHQNGNKSDVATGPLRYDFVSLTLGREWRHVSLPITGKCAVRSSVVIAVLFGSAAS